MRWNCGIRKCPPAHFGVRGRTGQNQCAGLVRVVVVASPAGLRNKAGGICTGGGQIPETTKPGWFARLSYCGTGSSVLFGSASQNVKILPDLRGFPPKMLRTLTHPGWLAGLPALRVTVRGVVYITIARFSSSCCRTGRAHPAISTRPAASSAAFGETPYPRPIRKT